MHETALAAASVEQHRGIMEALGRGDLAQTSARVEENWRFGMNALLQHLDWQ
jgi:DNA-binding GntR family transcriptional regulator